MFVATGFSLANVSLYVSDSLGIKVGTYSVSVDDFDYSLVHPDILIYDLGLPVYMRQISYTLTL